jgi:cytochrome oxidase assembly protein ShyY1
VFRFLLTRRWLGLLLAVVLLGFTCVELGLWQFRRYSERHDSNESIRTNLAAAPVPVDRVMSTNQPVSDTAEWTKVVATGTYDASHEVIVLYRTRDGAAGVDIVVPLVTSSGTALLVDRGWIQTAGNANQRPNVPAPPAGTVTVNGWVRRNASGGSVTPSNGYVRAISSDALKSTLPYPVYDGFLDRTKESPSATTSPAPALPPDLSAGPSFFYGIQWFFFACLAFGFWVYFAWAEYTHPQTALRVPVGSERSREPAVDREHHPGDVTGGR